MNHFYSLGPKVPDHNHSLPCRCNTTYNKEMSCGHKCLGMRSISSLLPCYYSTTQQPPLIGLMNVCDSITLENSFLTLLVISLEIGHFYHRKTGVNEPNVHFLVPASIGIHDCSQKCTFLLFGTHWAKELIWDLHHNNHLLWT